jgi:hypothetical protein
MNCRSKDIENDETIGYNCYHIRKSNSHNTLHYTARQEMMKEKRNFAYKIKHFFLPP